MINDFKMRTGTLLMIITSMSANFPFSVTTSQSVGDFRCCTALSEAKPAHGNAFLHKLCDWDLKTGWYHFEETARDQMSDKCLLMWCCGTQQGWLNGSYPTPCPTVAEGLVTRKFCYRDHNNCCRWNNSIKVKNCGGYYMYELQKPPPCFMKCRREYCGNAGAAADGTTTTPAPASSTRMSSFLRSISTKSAAEATKKTTAPASSTRMSSFLRSISTKSAEEGTKKTTAPASSTRMSSFLRSISTKSAEEGTKKTPASASSTRLSSFSRSPSTKSAAEGTTTTPAPASSTRLSSLLSSSLTKATSMPTASPTLSSLLTTLTAATMPTAATTVSPSVLLLPSSASSSLSFSAVPSSSSLLPISPRLKEVERKFISSLDTIDIQQNTSLQEAVILIKNTTEQYMKTFIQQVQDNATVEQERRKSIFKMAAAFEKFVLNYSNYHVSESTPQIHIVSNNLVVRIQRGFGQNASDFLLDGPGRQTSIKVPSINFNNNETVVIGIVYKDLHELFITNHSKSYRTEDTRRLNSLIVAVTMNPKPGKLQENVAINFSHLKVADKRGLCVFWSGLGEKSSDGWSDEGCHAMKSTRNSKETECSCNHMTHFAVLFDYSDTLEITKTDEKILSILTYVGLALSITGVTLTIISYAVLTDVNQPLSQIRMSLAGSLGVGQIIFLAGINATENPGACVAVAALVQYFLMTAFCWMLVEGIYLYLLVVKVYNINNKMAIYHVMSWGIPAVMVAMSLSIAAGKDGIQSFIDGEYCWMSSDNNLIWIFVVYVVVIETLNLLILVRVIKEMATMQTTDDNDIHQIRLGIKACVVMSPLLGITWLFGLLSPLHKAFVYIFTVLNSLQGFLIFLLHCARNSQIRERFKRRMNTVFPAVRDGKSARKTSKVNESGVSAVRTIEVQSYNSVFELE